MEGNSKAVPRENPKAKAAREKAPKPGYHQKRAQKEH
jgi:hypothetical protein